MADAPRRDDRELKALAERAAAGDRAAASTLIAEVEDDVYRLAMRMLGHPADAEDAAQEILVKVLTHLGSYRGESAFRTWLFSVAANHLRDFRRGQREVWSFEAMEGFIAQGLAAADAGPQAAPTPEAEARLLTEEVRIGCTQGAMMSLDRDHRIAFALGELVELDGAQAAAVLGVDPATYRKRLSRARARLTEFMSRNCGIVAPERPCRCAKQVGPSVAAGFIDPQRLVYGAHPVAGRRDPELLKIVAQMDDLEARSVELLRAHPPWAAPETLTQKIRDLLASGRYSGLDA